MSLSAIEPTSSLPAPAYASLPNDAETKVTTSAGLIFQNGIPVAYEEPIHNGWCQRFHVKEVLLDEQTDYQHLLVFDSGSAFGKVLVLDDAVQITELDHRIYSEMLAHLPILAHGAVKKVLIIGGGDGSILREVLRHKEIEPTLVEIDRRVIEATKKYLPGVCEDAFENPRAHVFVQDAIEYVKECKERGETFDVIICDSTDPVSCGEPLFSPEFYSDCHALLGPRGIFVNQNGVPTLQPEEIGTILKREAFAHAGFYQATVPSYCGGQMLLGWASDDTSWMTVPQEVLEERFSALSGEMQYYTPKIHTAAFALPAFVERTIAAFLADGQNASALK